MRKMLRNNLFRVVLFVLMLGIGITGVCIYQHSSAESPLRLHVIANSDSTYDQQVKLIVRDEILEILQDKFSDIESKEDAMLIISENIPLLEESCREVLKDYADYDLYAYLGEASFPTKSYGNMVLPAGEYDALKIILGEGEGRNWWCVLFPSLCFIDLASNKEQTVMSVPGEMNNPVQEKVEVRLKLNELLD